MISGQARLLLAQAGGALAVAVLVAGCGNNYRPTVTPVSSSGPPAQVTSYAVAVSSTSPTAPGEAYIIDYSGDSIIAQAAVGTGPLAFTIDEIGGTGYIFNSDHTITNFPISTTLQTKNETVTTLPSTALPVNLSATASALWISDLDGNTADLFTGSPQTFKLSIPIGTTSAPASTPVVIAGAPTAAGQRQYVISQNLGTTPTGIECNTAQTAGSAPVGPLGTATPIETSSLTADVSIPVGHCPVFAVQSPDQRRLFVLNRGDDTITVIDSQKNALNDGCPPPTGCVNQNNQQYFTHPVLPLSTNGDTNSGVAPPNGAPSIAVAGPVYAEYNLATSQLVVADYDGNAVSVIDVSLDQYGNDSPTFGTTYTIPLGAGANPAGVTALFDGSRAYTANQGNGTVSIVNLSSHSIEKTLPVVGHPRTVVSTQNSLFGKVYVAAPDSNAITIIQTQTDLVDTTVLVSGNVLDVRTTTQNGGSQSVTTYNGTASVSNPNFMSRVPGWGQPCNLPGVPAPTGTQTPLQACQALP